MLRNSELRVLIALHDNPLGDINSLSRLAEISPATFARSLNRLQAKGILDKRGFVSAQISYSAAGLELIPVFIDTTHKNWMVVEKMCDNHPYIVYRTRCFGAMNGIFALFAVPVGSVHLLLQLFDNLKKNRVFSDYSMRRLLNQQVYTEANFRYYDNKTGTWNFDWNSWGKTMNESNHFELEECPLSVLHQMTPADMQILKQLSMSARKERKEIAREVGIPPYYLSRRLKFYRYSRLIGANRILFGLASLNLVAPALIECTVDTQAKERIAYAVSKLPFQGNFIPTETGFILYTTLPASDFSKFADVLMEHVEDVSLMWCDYASSVRYWFEGGVQSNFRDGKWVATKELMLDDILKSLGLQ